MKHIHIPPVCLAITGLTMWLFAEFAPLVRFGAAIFIQAGTILIFGGFIAVAMTAAQMLKQKAAIHPHDEPTNLVTNGMFKWSRNPIYTCMLFVLIGWACHLDALTPWLGPPAFAWWITKHFIKPEEKRLIDKFDSRYRQYMATTRRWL